MKTNSSKMMFMSTMMIGIILSISSNNWMMMWCGLEISLISFIPLMINKLVISSESSMKYFIVQSISSLMLMLSMLIMVMKGDYNYNYVFAASLLMKMGVAPFHNWVLTVLEGLDHYMVIIMLTINKITPLTLMMYTKNNLMLIICLTMIIGSMMSLNQNSIKKLIGYSSIFNMGLVLSILNINLMWIMFMTLYSILIFMIIKTTLMMKTSFINQMIFSDKVVNKLSIWMILLSMGGLPPMMGFTLKYITISYMIEMKFIFMITLMVMLSLIVMMMYLRMTFMSMLNNSMINKTSIFNMKSISMWMMMLNTLSLPMILMFKLIN
uniref:NADH-ubiquinone oxidoreductase chain 2 n=1 Tax=Typhlocybinae gen. 1 sp. 1 BY-2021a TaxID=2893157 RepID=A0A9E6XSA6_9HEMI|nr:NADH dehydrogenase subunit 2 [Typhlocybinae gen. 1 sp. 1 BY-2021a]